MISTIPCTQRRTRTVFDLSPQELHELYKLNLKVSASVPPCRPSRSSAFTQVDHAFDLGVYERYRDLHARARSERSAWLKAQGISHKVAEQAVLTDYNPMRRRLASGAWHRQCPRAMPRRWPPGKTRRPRQARSLIPSCSLWRVV